MIVADRTDIDLLTETVAALTRAALQRNADGAPCDFSDFLARALAAAAANVGGPDRLIAGRPGSWESSCVDGLVRGTAGNDRDDWAWFRTQPIIVRLNVAELIEDEQHHPGLMGLDEALENIGSRYESAASEAGPGRLGPRDRHGHRPLHHGVPPLRRAVHARGPSNCRSGPGLSADVFVEADTDPNSTWWSTTATNNPSERGSDQLALDIWRAAHDITQLPNVDIWLGAGLPIARSAR